MIQDPQEYLQQWEKENNPFYPDEMRWDRVKVNTFLKDWKHQCNIAYVVGRSEQYFCLKEQIEQRCSEQCLGCFQFQNKD